MTQSASIVCKRYRENHKDEFYISQNKRRETIKGRLIVILSSARERARRKNIAFDITINDLLELYNSQEGMCAISKLKMELTTGPREKANNLIVSLDRIIPARGYLKDNIQLVCLAVNRIKWNFTDEEFRFWIRTISREAFKDILEEPSTTISKESTLK